MWFLSPKRTIERKRGLPHLSVCRSQCAFLLILSTTLQHTDMSSVSHSAKHGRIKSFGDNFDISDLSFAPTPPPHKHARQRSSISSIGSRSTSQSKFGGSVIWNKPDSLPRLYDPGQTSMTFASSEFNSSHISSEPPGLTESSGTSWSTASSSFQTSSGITLEDGSVRHPHAPYCQAQVERASADHCQIFRRHLSSLPIRLCKRPQHFQQFQDMDPSGLR